MSNDFVFKWQRIIIQQYKVDWSTLEKIHVGNFDGDSKMAYGRGRRATKHLPPSQRLRDYSKEHLIKMYHDLCFQTGIEINQHLNWESQYAHELERKFDDMQIDNAHFKFVDAGHKVYKIGRPQDSKNAPPDALEALEGTDVDIVSVDEAVNIISMDEAPAIMPPQSMDKYALRTELYKVSDALERALKGYCEGNFKTAFDRLETHDNMLIALENALANIQEHRPTLVELKLNELPTVSLGIQHKHFPLLLKMCNARLRSGHHLNIWIHGPAGTGKSTAAHNVAKALGLDFYTDGKLEDGFEAKGYRDGHGNYNTTQFRQAFENGGIYLADEIDGSMPTALLAFNAALANGHCAFPDKLVERHPDFIFLAAANTTGTGATLEYVGRFKQDAAFNDRFCFLSWPVDTALEDAMSANTDWTAHVRAVRDRLAVSGIKGHLITPRATLYGEALLAAGLTLDETNEAVLTKGLTPDQWNKIK